MLTESASTEPSMQKLMRDKCNQTEGELVYMSSSRFIFKHSQGLSHLAGALSKHDAVNGEPT